MNFEKGLKKAAFAYVGAIAYAYEATKKAVDLCVEKGAKTIDELRPKGEDIFEKVKTTVYEKFSQTTVFDSLNDFIDSLSPEEKDQVRDKLNDNECKSQCCSQPNTDIL